ncbi:MAG: epoxyqueuosine reductase [Clostridia bacterium]|nr:epoxyqueuosine reductase [Clostridia bacterium]
MLQQGLQELFAREGIERAAVLPFENCRVTMARLYTRVEGFVPQSVIVFLIPYFSREPENFSAYATAEDYHYFAKGLYERLNAALGALYPAATFLGFADHSPIDERDAAVKAGLGVFGKNRLLLSKEYGSYQFIGEFLSDLPVEMLGTVDAITETACMGCDACLRACPTGVLRGESAECLSAITQKKGELSPEEKALMRRVGTAWGCDECQKVCPYTKGALARGTARTTIPYFKENLITRLDSKTLDALDEEAFSRRAFAWRGRATVERNVKILEEDF